MSSPGPVLGPCEAWISGDEVAASCPGCTFGDATFYDVVAVEASMALYEVSGRVFTGPCPYLVRPCRDPCQCWGPTSLGSGPFMWSWDATWGGLGGWSWANEFGPRVGCGVVSKVTLNGYPVTEIIEVKIDGTVLDPLDANGNRNWRLDRWRHLVRLDDPVTGLPRRWPACQDLSLDDTAQGTWSVSYRSGVQPPELGRRAAVDLACQLALSAGGQDCDLPTGATRVTRQGVTVDRGLLLNWFDRRVSTGIASLDLFLAAYWPTRAQRRSAVWSPDTQRYPLRMT